MADHKIAEARPVPEAQPAPMPPLRVQRMGKLFRIVYEETRNLARYNSGEPVDKGGFSEEIEGQIFLAKVTSTQGPTTDPEAERVE